MNKIEQFLINRTDSLVKASSTLSTYFSYKGLKIRYSDHFSSTTDASIQIIYSSVVESPYYALFYRSNRKMAIANAKKIIELLDTLCITEKFFTQEKESEFSSVINSESTWQIKDLTIKTNLKGNLKLHSLLAKPVERWSQTEINKLTTILILQFKTSKGVNTEFQKWLKVTPISTLELLYVYRELIIVRHIGFDEELANKVLAYIRDGNTTSAYE